jgi:MATE family multidrug resistance protein
LPRIDISYRRIVKITWPVVITQLSYTAMGVIDTIMVGQLGVTALGAVGLAAMVTWTVFSFFWGLLSGVNTLVAQAVGAGDRRAAGVAFWQGIYLALTCGAFILVLWPLVPRIFVWSGATPEVQKLATEYMHIRLLGGLGFAMFLVADNFYRGLGRTRVPMYCGIVQMLLNCGLNWVLIFGKLGAPALGTNGAALGTVIVRMLVGLLLFGSIVLSGVSSEFHVREGRPFHRRVFVGLTRLSLPIGVQTVLEMTGISVFTALIARLGDAELAATNAVIQAWSVAFLAAGGLSVGATTLVGQVIGAGEPEEARRVVRRVLRLGYGLVAVTGMLYIALPHQLMALFVTRAELPALLPFARPLFLIVVVCLVFDLQFAVLSGALRGAGDTTYAMLVNLGSAWLLFVPATVLVTPRFGLIGAWACLILHVFAMATLLVLRVRGSVWLKPPQVRASEPAIEVEEESSLEETRAASQRR